MEAKQPSPYSLSPKLNLDNNTVLNNKELQRLFTYFHTKLPKEKTNFHFYIQTGIVLAAITKSATATQVIYLNMFYYWVLPAVSACAIVLLIFSVLSVHKEYVSIQEKNGNNYKKGILFNQQQPDILMMFSTKNMGLFRKRSIQP